MAEERERLEDLTTEEVIELVGDPMGGSSRLSDRDEVIALLLLDDRITRGDARAIRENLPDDAPLEDVMGWISGELQIAPVVLERITQGTDVHMSSYQIEAKRQNWTRYPETAAGQVRSYLGYPTEFLGEAIQDVTGFRGFGGGESVWDNTGIAGIFITSDEEAAEKADREYVRDKTREEIRWMLSKGYITDERATKMLSVTDNYDEGTYRNLFDEITEIMADVPSTKWEWNDIVKHASVMQDLRRRGNYVDSPDVAGPDGVSYEYGEGVLSPEDIARTEARIASGAVGDTAFRTYLEENGEAGGMTDEEIADKLAQMQAPYMAYASAFGFTVDKITDPSTGESFTPAEWNAILNPRDQADHTLRNNYLISKQTAGILPEVERIVEKLVMPGTKTETIPGYYDANLGRYIPPREVNRSNLPRIPAEDLAIKSPVPTAPWEVPAVEYRVGDGIANWQTMSARERAHRLELMKNEGLINQEAYDLISSAGGSEFLGASIWESANAYAFVTQTDPIHALHRIGLERRAYEAMTRPSGRGSGRSAPKYSVPASLREIPDYEALAQESKQIFGQRMGREMEDWELAIISDELQRAYKMQNKEKIEAHRAAWEDAVSGGTVDVENIEVTNPAYEVDYYIEEKYAPELDRQDRVAERGLNNALLLDSLTVGKRMI